VTEAEFTEFYPQFAVVVTAHPKVIAEYLKQAHNICDDDRWMDMRDEGIRLYVAHKLTLYLKTLTANDASDAQIAAAGDAKGIKTNKAVAGVSVGMAESSATSGLPGWGAFKTTEYGIQFMTLARMVGMGGMYVP
jgi:hypothetical protein